MNHNFKLIIDEAVWLKSHIVIASYIGSKIPNISEQLACTDGNTKVGHKMVTMCMDMGHTFIFLRQPIPESRLSCYLLLILFQSRRLVLSRSRWRILTLIIQ